MNDRAVDGIDRKANPVMLVLGRESRGYSQTALAKKVGALQATLSKIESGLLPAPKILVEKIADALNYPPSFFYQSHRFQQLPMSFFRKRKKLASGDVRAIRAKINIARLRLEVLLRSGEVPEPRLVLTDLQKTGGTPEETAALLRVRWNLAPGPIADLTKTIEDAGILVVFCDFETDLMDGVSLYEPGDTLPPMIFVSPRIPGDRLRWTLSHELAHIVLHHHLSVLPDDEDTEKEANLFASEFLMPAREIRGQLGYLTMQRLAQLKVHWKVSMRAILNRAVALDRVSKRSASYLWMNLGKAGGTTEPVSIEAERPSFVRDLVGKHLKEYHYSTKDLATVLHQSIDELRAEYALQQSNLRLG